MREKDVSNAGLIWRIWRSSGRLCYHFHFKQAEILFLPLQNLLLFLPLKSMNAGSREVLLLLPSRVAIYISSPSHSFYCPMELQSRSGLTHQWGPVSESRLKFVYLYIYVFLQVFYNFLSLYLCISEFNGKQARPSEREWVNCNAEVKFATNQMSD